MNRTLLAAVCLVAVAWPPARANDKASVKPGISDRTTRSLSTQTAERLERRIAAHLARLQASVEPLERDTTEHSKALAAALERQRAAGQLKLDLEAFRRRQGEASNITDGPKRLAEMRLVHTSFEQLCERYRPTMSSAWRASRVDRAALERLLNAALVKYVDGRWRLIGPGTATGRLSYDSGTVSATTPDPEPPGPTAFTFARPYALQQTSFSQGGLPSAPGRHADREDGTISTSCAGIVANGGEGRAQLGVEVTVPAGYSKLKVVADLGLYQHILGGATGGACGSGTGSYLQLVGTDGVERLYEVENLSGWCVGLWTYDQGLYDDYRIAKTFTIPNTGGEYQVYVGNYAWAWGGALALGWAYSDDTVLSISVEALP